jgi:predicted NAD/FAD-binding protein
MPHPAHDEHHRRRRLQLNEKLFEALNHRLEEQIQELREAGLIPEDPDAPIRYLCECSREDCRERFSLEPEEYQRLHSDPRDCVVLQGHEMLDIEAVVDEIGDLLVVRKRPI